MRQGIDNAEPSTRRVGGDIALETISDTTSPTIVKDGTHGPSGILLHTEPEVTQLTKSRTIVTLATLTGPIFLNSLTNGLIAVGLPRTAEDINLPDNLLVWPAAVFSLSCGSIILLVGSVADHLGNRLVNLIGCFFTGCFVLSLGLAQTGIELILLRAFQGVAVSLCFPTSVAIVTAITRSGKQRNLGFAALGFVQPLGYSVGIVLEGVIVNAIGWRFGYYFSGGLMLLLFLVALWVLPNDPKREHGNLRKLPAEIDWIGALLACSGLGFFSYILATLTSGISKVKDPANLTLSIITLCTVPLFVLWENRQERLQKPALMPNFLWKNPVFTSICVMVMTSYGVLNSMELYSSLFFQQVQGLSALETSIRLMPNMVIGVIIQLSTGFFVHRVSAFYLVEISLILTAGSPLLMALINTEWPYWYDAFFAQVFAPLSADILFTVGLLVISDIFPPRTQALAGAVFSTVTQLGTSIGLTVMAVIASSVSQKEKATVSSQERLMAGYRASFWVAFAWMVLASVIGCFGLRGIGKIGLKRD